MKTIKKCKRYYDYIHVAAIIRMFHYFAHQLILWIWQDFHDSEFGWKIVELIDPLEEEILEYFNNKMEKSFYKYKPSLFNNHFYCTNRLDMNDTDEEQKLIAIYAHNLACEAINHDNLYYDDKKEKKT